VTDTISYHRARPFQRNLDMSGVSVSAVSEQWKKIQEFLMQEEGTIKKSPEEDALWFYMANHAMEEIRRDLDEYEPLGGFEKFVNNYHEMMEVKSLRMFYYLLMITTRESRWCHEGASLSKLWTKYPEVGKFHKSILKLSEMQAVGKFVDSPPDMTLGKYTEFLVKQFNEAQYNSAYGGKAWGQVASCLNEFVWGRISAEMMMDTAFTLCHNNGPIFNKGMVYNTYDAAEIRKILDVQNSGQIPQLVAEKGTQYVTEAMIAYHSEFETLAPNFGGYVDWYKVEQLGSKGSYGSCKLMQDQKHGKPQKVAQSEKVIAMKAKAAAIKKTKETKEFLKTHIEIMPQVFVKKVERSVEGNA